MTRQQLDLVKEIMKADNLEDKIDKLFCELKGLICLGSNDERSKKKGNVQKF